MSRRRAKSAAARQRAAQPEPAAPARPRRWPDIVIVAAIAIGWFFFARFVAQGAPSVAYDTFRDMAYAENILAGRFWDDPSLPGYSWWYPPGNPLAFAALARLLGQPLAALYTSSMFWLNVLNPILLYFVVRVISGSRAAGIAALGLTGLGSYWWLTHAAAPMPSVQGVALNLGTLLVWHRAQRGGWRWAVATGLLIAASAWHHAMCGMFLVAAIGSHGLISLAQRPDATSRRTAVLWRAVIACGIGLALAAPLLWHLLTPARINAAPFLWFGPELHDPRYAIHVHAPLVPLLGLIGLWRILRAMPAAGWVVGYFAAGLAGQLLGYAGHDLKWPVPYTLPHEFQWHEQLALGIAAAVGLVWLAGWIAARPRFEKKRRRLHPGLIVGVGAMAVGPAVLNLNDADYVLTRMDAGWRTTLETCRWIREHVPIGDVIAVHPDAGYYMNGLTGRKVVALPTGHMNPASDVRRRYNDLQSLLTTPDPARFAEVARPYGVRHLMVLVGGEQKAAAHGLYASWPQLERADLGDVDILFYHVRDSIPR